MSFMEQHIVDHCHTADDVMKAAALVCQKRAALRPKIEPTRMVIEPEITVGAAIEPTQIAELPPGPIDPPANYIKISHVQKAVAHKFGIELIDLRGDCRSPIYATPRHISFVLCRCLTMKSFPEIGRRTGGRDHTTVIHGIKKYRWLTDQLRAELTPESPLSAWVNRAYELVKQKNE